MPLVSTRFGEGAAKRLALQFAYEYFKRTEMLDLFDAIFEATWADFVAEIEAPNRDIMAAIQVIV
jgi:hypothetical protein